MEADQQLQVIEHMEDVGRELATNVKKAVEDLKKFSKCLRSVHEECTISAESENYKNIITVRHDMTKYGIIFVELVHPFFTEILECLRRVTESYLSIDFKDRESDNEHLLELLSECEKLCKVTFKLFGSITPILKRTEDNSKSLKRYIERRSQALSGGWGFQKTLGAFIGTVGATGGTVILASAAAAAFPVAVGGAAVFWLGGKHSASKQQLQWNETEESFVRNSITEPIEALNKTLEGVFSFITKHKNALSDRNSPNKSDLNQQNYRKMKAIAALIDKHCSTTIAAMPNILSDLRSLPFFDVSELEEEIGILKDFINNKTVTCERGELLDLYLTRFNRSHQDSSKKFRETLGLI